MKYHSVAIACWVKLELNFDLFVSMMDYYVYHVPSIQPKFVEHKRRKYLRESLISLKKVPELTLLKLFKRSERFPIEFPIESVRSKNILKSYSALRPKPAELSPREIAAETLLDNALEAYPIVHEEFFQLAIEFLDHKKKFGSKVEQAFYSEIDLIAFVTRLLRRRAVSFFGANENYLLLNGISGRKDDKWGKVGTKNELTPFTLKNCLSYDEMKLSGLISISSPTFFINNGSRTNCGIIVEGEEFEKQGIAIGIAASQLEKFRLMEYQDMIVNSKQNKTQHGYGKQCCRTDSCKYDEERALTCKKFSQRADILQMFARFYSQQYYPTWKEITGMLTEDNNPAEDDSEDVTNNNDNDQSDSYVFMDDCNDYFARYIYQTRCRLMAEIILLDANERGLQNSQKVFLHIGDPGLGSAAVSVCTEQETAFLDGFAEAILKLDLQNISDIFFNLLQEDSTCGEIGNNECIGQNMILLHFGIRYPHGKIPTDYKKEFFVDEYSKFGLDASKLLVVTYPCSENSLPGNEFWSGLVAASGDSSEASSSQIAELHNPHINPMIIGQNMRVACPSTGKVLPISEYLDSQLVEIVVIKEKMHNWLGDV